MLYLPFERDRAAIMEAHMCRVVDADDIRETVIRPSNESLSAADTGAAVAIAGDRHIPLAALR
jgi:hypothetical protein